jgi:uncharacterized protein (TIGR00255 family)
MLRSMTGYARSESKAAQGDIVVEVKSSNHRFCDISLRIPQRCFALEHEIKKLILTRLKRGRIDLSIQLENKEQEELGVELNLPLAQRYYILFKELKELLKLPGEITLNQIVTQKDIIVSQSANQDTVYDWEMLKGPLSSALDTLVKMRETEGALLQEDFLSRLKNIELLLEQIQAIANATFKDHQESLLEKIQSLCNNIEIDESRLVQEVAYLVEKSDITEELVRTQSHLLQFRKCLDSDDVVGRKLDFLIQEIHREINTISSKSYHAEISHKAVEIKNELERMREQVQNIE